MFVRSFVCAWREEIFNESSESSSLSPGFLTFRSKEGGRERERKERREDEAPLRLLSLKHTFSATELDGRRFFLRGGRKGGTAFNTEKADKELFSRKRRLSSKNGGANARMRSSLFLFLFSSTENRYRQQQGSLDGGDRIPTLPFLSRYIYTRMKYSHSP